MLTMLFIPSDKSCRAGHDQHQYQENDCHDGKYHEYDQGSMSKLHH